MSGSSPVAPRAPEGGSVGDSSRSAGDGLQLAVDHLPAAAAVPTTATAAEFTPDTRLVPAAAAAWLGMWLASSGAAWALVLHAALVAVTVVVALQRRSWQAVAVTLVLSGCLVAGGLRAWQLAHGPVAELAEARAVVALEVEVTGEPRLVVGGVGGPATYVPADVVAVEGRGRSWALRQPVVVRGGAAWAGVTVGSRLALSGRLAEADDGRAEAALVHSLGEPRVLGPPPLWLEGIERIRQGLRAAVAGTTPERAALVPALVVGDTSSMTPELQADFRVTGLTHLTAVSGANLTLLLVFVTTVARAVGARGRALTGLAVVSVVAFVALCRSEPSVLRAAAMGLVGLAALGRTPAAGSGVRNLSLAVLVLCWVDPWLSRSWGFTLSVVACGGILWWGRAWAEALRRWLPAWLADSVAVPLAAQLATQPVVTAISGQVSLAGLVANLLAAPFVGPATVLGLVAALASQVSPFVASLAGWCAGWAAEGILQVAHAMALLPGATVAWPATPLGVAGVMAASVAAGTLAGRWLARPVVVICCLAAMVLAVMRPPPVLGWPAGWTVLACDVGQGDALLVRAGPRQAVVVDVGPDGAALVSCLDRAGVDAVPLLVLSHFHADHVGGLGRLLASRRVGTVLVSPLASPPATAAWVRDSAARAGAVVRSTQAGDQLTAGDARWETLAAGAVSGADVVGEGESSAENDSSVVGRLTSGGLSVLVTGDLELAGQRAVLAGGGSELRVDVLKVPHHGSSRQDPAFVAATRARFALISCGIDNAYGHPAAKTLRLLESLGMQVLRTDRQGSLALSGAGERVSVVVQR